MKSAAMQSFRIAQRSIAWNRDECETQGNNEIIFLRVFPYDINNRESSAHGSDVSFIEGSKGQFWGT